MEPDGGTEGGNGARAGRRRFLKAGLGAAGAAAGLGTLGHAVVRAEIAKADAWRIPTPALTSEHCLVHVDGDRASPAPAPRPPSDPAVRDGMPGRKWVMVIDLARCEGCRACTANCGRRHHVPAPREWIRVHEMRDAESAAPYWLPKPCFHCDNPPCTKVCPVGATFKRRDGIVLVDNERCIGCRFCMAACPYSARSFNWGPPAEPPEARARAYSPETGYPRRVGTVEKCDWCPDMLAQGKLPCCVAQCAQSVLWFGDENEDAVTNARGETVRLSTLLRDHAGWRLLEDLGTEPRVWYLPPRNRMHPAPGEAAPAAGGGR